MPAELFLLAVTTDFDFSRDVDLQGEVEGFIILHFRDNRLTA
jgi:hypothetical protein